MVGLGVRSPGGPRDKRRWQGTVLSPAVVALTAAREHHIYGQCRRAGNPVKPHAGIDVHCRAVRRDLITKNRWSGGPSRTQTLDRITRMR